MRKDAIKTLIEMAETVEAADSVIEEFTEVRSTGEKLAYLYGMFDVTILAKHGQQDDVDADYYSVLSTIVNQKWR